MAEEVAALSVRLEATAARFERDMRRAQRSMERATGRMERRADRFDRRMERFGSRFGINLNLQVIAATAAMAALGKAINDVVRNGDRLKQLEGRFKALTGSAERASNLIGSAFTIGTETGAPLDAITEALTRFRIAGDAINATDEEVAKLTENLLKLGTIGGSTTQELTAGAIQLGQGLASGRLQGEELRSVMENLPLVARELAEGLGVSVGKLREMGAEGELTAERVFGALIRGSDEIDRKFRELPLTVERAANQMASAWTRFTAELEKSVGVGNLLAQTLDRAAQHLNALSQNMASAADNARDLRIMELSDEIRQMESDLEGMTDVAKGLGFGDRMQRELQAAREELRALMAEARQGAESFRSNFRIGRASEAAQIAGGLGPPRGETRRGPGAVSTSPVPPRPPFDLGVPEPVSTGGGGGGGGSARAVVDESAVRLLESLRERIELLREEQQLVGTSAIENARLSAAFERQRIEQELLNAAAREGATITPEQIAQAKEMAALYEREAIALAQMEEALRAKQEAEREAEEAAQRHAQAVQQIGDAITGAIQQADSFADALKNVALQLANIALQGLSQPGGGILGSLFGGLFGGGAAPATSPIPVPRPSAKGNVFQQGRITPFASGGIVRNPTLFPMAQGAGLMGEAGPEAILPLKRGPGGRLGVEGGGGGGNVYHIDARGTSMEVVNELRKTLFELAGPGKVERRAVNAVSTAQHRGQRLGPRG